MNSYGLVLNEIGMEATFDALQACCLRKIGSLLFPVEGLLDRHHSFIVQYAAGKDLGLDMHVDNSDVTFNVCLGRKFRGAGLTFCGYMGDPHHRHRSHVYHHGWAAASSTSAAAATAPTTSPTASGST